MKNNHEHIRALAIQQPFAALITHTKLLVRSWNTPFRGQVLIGSTLKGISDFRQHCNAQQHDYLEYLTVTDSLFDQHNCALFLADLIDTRPLTPAEAQRAQTLYKKNHWCFYFSNIRHVCPFPFHGHHRTLRTLSAHALLKLRLGHYQSTFAELTHLRIQSPQ